MWMVIVSHTPVWVWLVLIYLLWIGVRARTPQPVHRPKIVLLPVIILLMSLPDLQGPSPMKLMWLSGLVIGLGVGYLLFHSQIQCAYCDANQVLYLPGHSNLLIVLLLVFSCHYTLAVLTAMHPSDLWSLTNILLTGLTNGLFFCRALLIYHQYRHQAWLNTEQS